jgi:hypothetical protein
MRTPFRLQAFYDALIASFVSRRNYGYALSQKLTTSNALKTFRNRKGILK